MGVRVLVWGVVLLDTRNGQDLIMEGGGGSSFWKGAYVKIHVLDCDYMLN